jgi:hypothetical protein
MTAPFVHLDPLLGEGDAERLLRVAESFGPFPTYGSEAAPEEQGKPRFAPAIPQRYDAALHFVRTGGRLGRREDPQALAGRTNYLRATYAYGRPVVAGVEGFLAHEGLADAARRVHGRPVVVPSIVYANLLLPGQELAVHTDVPEFRGADRTRLPQWLLVVMLHSGLFRDWRRPIATGIAYFGACQGGALAFYPDGPEAPPRTLPPRHDTALVLDTDTVFHGVDRVEGAGQEAPPFRPGMQLVHEGGGRWRLFEGAETLAHYRWDEIRYSVSWKAWCYEDERDRERSERHEDDLSLELILHRLEEDLRASGRLEGPRPPDDDFARLLIDTYVRFPGPHPPA